MKRLLRNRFLSAVAVLLLLGCVYWCVYRMTTSNANNLMQADQPELAWLKQEFALNDEQFDKIKSVHLRFDAECYVMCQNLAESQNQLNLQISQNSTITPEVKAALSKTVKLQEYCRQATLQYMYRICEVMTPEQSDRYRDTMAKSMMTAGRVPHLNDPGELHDHILHHSAVEDPATHD